MTALAKSCCDQPASAIHRQSYGQHGQDRQPSFWLYRFIGPGGIYDAFEIKFLAAAIEASRFECLCCSQQRPLRKFSLGSQLLILAYLGNERICATGYSATGLLDLIFIGAYPTVYDRELRAERRLGGDLTTLGFQICDR
ncbi:hypothetical protein ER13_14180 [Brevundimonas sp. EAKA]|nr:hypothetical protein ER13_14180 [Brevundimonas sp. EAKA]